MFYNVLVELSKPPKTVKAKGGSATSGNTEYRSIKEDVERIMNKGQSRATQHPKLGMVKNLLINHLATHGEDDIPTKCMVFCSFRAGVGELVDLLNEDSPLIRAHKFVGRATGKDITDKGLTQAEQKKVIEKFKKGDYNVLVSTSIGEEGLDIGEIDFIIIYNCPSESIKAVSTHSYA